MAVVGQRRSPRCRRLVIGTGNHGALPVMKEVKAEARRRDSRDSLLQCGELQTCHQWAGRDKNQLPRR